MHFGLAHDKSGRTPSQSPTILPAGSSLGACRYNVLWPLDGGAMDFLRALANLTETLDAVSVRYALIGGFGMAIRGGPKCEH